MLHDHSYFWRQNQINGWKKEQTDVYLKTVWDTWHQRSGHDWSLDLSWLNRYGIDINPKRSVW
ncbi:MAG: hypothetical protein QNJ72_21505 [Pleurocapsa sp. MO_226.B13]|nr:hypothetical protein [Pleurocapsa sp. MO_226.B13]